MTGVEMLSPAEWARARSKAKAHGHTGFLAYTDTSTVFDDNSRVGRSNWPADARSVVALELWWHGVLKCSLGRPTAGEQFFYTRTATFTYKEGSHITPRILFRSIGTTGVVGEALRLSVCEVTGRIGS